MKGFKETSTQADPDCEDPDLVQRIQRSDVEAFRLLFKQYQPIVFRDAIIRTQDADLAHDIVQETFLRVWERRSSLQSNRSILGYLLRIGGNLARDAGRHKRTRERLQHDIPRPVLSEGDDPESALHLALLEERLTAIVNDLLPHRCRMVFVLSRLEGKSNKEIAALLRISVRTVEHQIGKALRIVRRELGKRGL